MVVWHVGLKQFKVQRDVEMLSIGSCDGCVQLLFRLVTHCHSMPVYISAIVGENALVGCIFAPAGCFPKVAVALEDISVIYTNHLIATNFDVGLFHAHAAQVLDHSAVVSIARHRQVILKARHTAPGTIIPYSPRFGNRTSSV